jgi:phosphohistidine phosphatase
MARQLWLLRHGEAEPHGSRPDGDRLLTERGEEQSRAAGRALAALGVTFSAVYASPKVRGYDTARLACEALGGAPVVHAPLSSGFGRSDALELIEAVGPDDRILVVGHEPDFSQTAFDLTGGRVDVKKGGVVGIRVESGAGELLVVLRPRELAAIAGSGA